MKIHLVLVIFVFAVGWIPRVLANPLGEWIFYPKYTLPGKASHFPGPYVGYETPQASLFQRDRDSPEKQLFGLQQTDEKRNLIDSAQLPEGPFTVEAWILDHVNRPVAASISALAHVTNEGWILGYGSRSVFAAMSDGRHSLDDAIEVQTSRDNRWKRWWTHLAMRNTEETIDLLINGKQVATRPTGDLSNKREAFAELEITAYLENEPHMILENLVRFVSLHDVALSDAQIVERFEKLCQQTEAGVFSQSEAHFAARPYLHFATTNSVNLSWETSVPTRGVLKYGTEFPLKNKVPFEEPKTIHDLEIPNLKPATDYFYEIESVTTTGEQLTAGPLTFQTAVEKGSMFSFALLGDTEARPHINDAIAKSIWSHRPNFVVHLGDITDGGKEPHKWQWNYEYFAGMSQLHGRIPVFTVVGNGESDLYWYSKYHRYPSPENYYTFRYGDAQFFMLDSNRKIAPGTDQYRWLDEELKRSTATWKFICHHHCAYSSDDDDYGDTWNGEPSTFIHKNVVEAIPLYEEREVDVVFYGHVHAFERSYPIRAGKLVESGGITYIESGGAGGNLEDFSPFASWFSSSKYPGHHYCIVRMTQDTFDFRMIDLYGRVRDQFVIEK